MAYSEQILRRAQQRLAQAKQEHDDEQQARIAAIYREYPRLQELDQALRRTMAQTMAACFQKGEDPQGAIAKLKEENLALQQERDWILQAAELDEQELASGSPSAPPAAARAMWARGCASVSWSCAVRSRKRNSPVCLARARRVLTSSVRRFILKTLTPVWGPVPER